MMKDEMNTIDQLFRGNLLNYSQNPPEALWKAIEQDLAKNQKRVLLPLYFKIAAGIIILLGLGTITWNYFRTSSMNNTRVASNQPTSIQQSRIKTIHNVASLPSRLTYTAQNEAPVLKEPALDEKVEIEHPTFANENTNFIASGHNELQNIQVSQTDIESPSDIETDLILAEEIATTREPVSVSDSVPVVEKENPDRSNYELIIQQNLLALEQENNKSDRQSSRIWSVGGQAGPQYSYRYVDVKEPDPYLNNSNKNQYEDPIFAYAGGIQIEMEPTKRFSIQSGVYYSKIGHQRTNPPNNNREDISYIWADPNLEEVNYVGSIGADKEYVNITGPIDNMDVGFTTVERYLEFLEVPFVFSYTIINKKFDVDVSSGIWADFLVGNKAYITTSASTTTEYPNKNINDLNLSASIGFGLNYPILKKLNFSLEPVFKYYLSPINTDAATNVYPYTFGLMSGLLYTF
jgi:hypothetical protein